MRAMPVVIMAVYTQSRLQANKNAQPLELSMPCTVTDNATCFEGTTETMEDIEGFFPDLRKWFFVEKDEKQAQLQPQTVPVNDMVKIQVSLEEYRKGEPVTHDVYNGFAMLTPDLTKRRATCYVAMDAVALRLWAKQPGKWYVVGIRVAIPDPARGKKMGRKVLTDEERRMVKDGEQPVRSKSAGPEDLQEAAEDEEQLISKHVRPAAGMRVKFRVALNQKHDEKRWPEAEGKPGTILEVMEEYAKMGVLKGDFCRVEWDATGFRQSYPTGFRDEFDLALYEVDEDGIEKGRMATVAQQAQKRKEALEKEKADRFTERYGTDVRATMDGVRGVKHLIGIDNWTPSKKSKIKPIDYLKMCFAVPMVKDQYPSIPTPLLQDPGADPYTHLGSPRASIFTPTKMGLRTPSVAIIGSGVTAATVARRLELLNYKITCFEKRNCQGGRLGNVRRGEEILSLGCPYFQATSQSFVREVQEWVHKGLVAPFDMNVGVLHGQCLGEFTHFDSLIPDPELYEKAKQMPGIVAAKRNVADGAGDIVGSRFGRFTTCRIWYDCASELWALEQKHAAIEKEVTAAENARDRGESSSSKSRRGSGRSRSSSPAILHAQRLTAIESQRSVTSVGLSISWRGCRLGSWMRNSRATSISYRLVLRGRRHSSRLTFSRKKSSSGSGMRKS